MPTKKRIQYRYTPTGQRAAMIDPDGGRFTYLYDNVKQLTAVINPQGQRTSYSYDAAGRRTVKKLANGSRTSFTYDLANRITSVAELKSDASVQARYDYVYDKAGNRRAMAETGHTTARTTWTYDAAYQVIGEHRTGSNPYRNTYTYDNRGNRTLKNLDGARTTATYDDANQLSWTQDAGGRTTYLYDADGNQQVVIPPSGQRTTNIWDYENRLIGVRHPSGARETLAYDPDGKRIQHETGAATTKYVWDGQTYLLETDASGITVATYTNEPTTYGRLISQRKSGATHYYVFDALGSTRLLTDSAEAVAESLLYDAWGNLVGAAPSMAVPFRWVGELGYLFVSSTGDYYVRERILKSVIGRWLSKDPIRQKDSLNFYNIVANRVCILTDPNGRQPWGGIPGHPGTVPPSSVYPPPPIALRHLVRPCPCTESDMIALASEFGVSIVIDLPDVVQDCHPGATRCYRLHVEHSDALYGTAGNQCCFDSIGYLITHGEGAGTPDIVSTMPIGLSPLLRHLVFDVLPFRRHGWEWYHAHGWAPVSDRDCPENWGGDISPPPPTEEQLNRAGDDLCFNICAECLARFYASRGSAGHFNEDMPGCEEFCNKYGPDATWEEYTQGHPISGW